MTRPLDFSGSEMCKSCNTGFVLDGHQCKAVACSCTNGIGATGVDCPTDGGDECTRCNLGYHLFAQGGSTAGPPTKVCQLNICRCTNGIGTTGIDCESHNAIGSVCASCEPGYHLKAGNCAVNSCTCPDGAGTTGTDCETHEGLACASCNTGFHLSSGACEPNLCSCVDGSAMTGVRCVHGAHQCAECDAGHFLDFGRCTACSLCDKAEGLVTAGGCTGGASEQDTVCLGTITHSSFQTPDRPLLANFSSIVTFTISSWHGPDISLQSISNTEDLVKYLKTLYGGFLPAVTIRPVCDDGGLIFTPPEAFVAGWQIEAGQQVPILQLATNIAVTPQRPGAHTVRFEIGGFTDCECRPISIPSPGGRCTPGCPNGSGFVKPPDEVVVVSATCNYSYLSTSLISYHHF